MQRKFLQETIDAITSRYMSPRDVRWVGVRDNWWMEWRDFEEEAKAYDNGFGWDGINPYLIVVADDWWLERREVDGESGWRFMHHPYKPDGYKRNHVSDD